MKMVASSKLHRAQQAIESMRPYEKQLGKIMSTFVANMEGELDTPYAGERPVKRVAIVFYTSNSSLCGAYNGNVIKAFHKKAAEYEKAGVEVAYVCPFGRKAYEAAQKAGLNIKEDLSPLLDHPSYEKTAQVASQLMSLYTEGEVDEVVLLYHHFKSAGTQVLTEETFLPIKLSTEGDRAGDAAEANYDFIVEPSASEVVKRLIPKSLHLKLFTALLDSLASEHAARVVAMQVATDNADELLRELNLTYNKTRQQAITTELLDIAGGSQQ